MCFGETLASNLGFDNLTGWLPPSQDAPGRIDLVGIDKVWKLYYSLVAFYCQRRSLMNINDYFARKKAQQEINIQTSIAKLHCATHDALDELYRDLTWELTEDVRDHLQIFTEEEVEEFFAKPLPHMEILALYIELEKKHSQERMIFLKGFSKFMLEIINEQVEDYRETESILSRIAATSEETHSTDEVRRMLDLED